MGVIKQVVLPMVFSPIIGCVIAFSIMMLLFALFANARPAKVNGTFSWLQRISAGLGTLTGGWRIIKTLGTHIIDLQPINGFAAETSATIVLATASALAMPVSTTHIVCGSIFGVGIAKRLNEVRWPIAQRMVTAWVFTLPGAALAAGLSFFLIHLTGSHPAAVALR